MKLYLLIATGIDPNVLGSLFCGDFDSNSFASSLLGKGLQIDQSGSKISTCFRQIVQGSRKGIEDIHSQVLNQK